jgi:peroxiredoxin
MRTKDIGIGVFALALLGLLGYMWFSPSGLKPAPELGFTTLGGEDIQLAALRGRPVLVTFWATTCGGCMEEMPHLIELYNELQPRGLEIIGVAMHYDPPNQVQTVRERFQVPYPIVLDLQQEAALAFGNVRLTPTTFLISPEGRIVKQTVGEMDMERVRRDILAMLTPTAS